MLRLDFLRNTVVAFRIDAPARLREKDNEKKSGSIDMMCREIAPLRLAARGA